MFCSNYILLALLYGQYLCSSNGPSKRRTSSTLLSPSSASSHSPHSPRSASPQNSPRNTPPRPEEGISPIIQAVHWFIDRLKRDHFELYHSRKERALSWRALFEIEDSSELSLVFAREYFYVLKDLLRSVIDNKQIRQTDFKFLVSEGFSDVIFDVSYCRTSSDRRWPSLIDLIKHAAENEEESIFNYIYTSNVCRRSPEIQQLLKTPEFWAAVAQVGANSILDFMGEHLGLEDQQLANSMWSRCLL